MSEEVPDTMSEVADYYLSKRVAVIGGAGMVGSKLVEQLLRFTDEIVVLDNFSRGRTVVPQAEYIVGTKQATTRLMYGWEMLAAGFPHARVISVDAGRPFDYWEHLKDVDVVFNLAAAVAGVLHNEHSHLQMYQDNVNVLAGPLRAARMAGVEEFLQTSSVCVYAEHFQCPCKEHFGFEDEPHPANAGYAESKRDGERMVHWSSIPRAVIVRPSNIVGERDYFDELAHVVPAFIKRAVELEDGDIFQAYGSSQVQREFIYSDDVASGMIWAMAMGENREAYNIGTSAGPEDKQNVITMLSLAHKVVDEVNYQMARKYGEVRVLFDNTIGGGDSLRYSDATKLRELGWKHSTDLSTIIGRTVKYYINEILGGR
jgi:nucleoside-diphosphate-sugar epimerase